MVYAFAAVHADVAFDAASGNLGICKVLGTDDRSSRAQAYPNFVHHSAANSHELENLRLGD